MREETTRERGTLAALRRGVVDGVGVKALASADISADVWAKALAGDKALHRGLAAFGSGYEQFRAVDPEAALVWAAGVLEAIGFDREVLSRLPQVRGTAEARTEATEALVATSKVVEADLSGAPVEERVALACSAVREATEALLAARVLQAQPSLALGGLR